MDLRGGDRTTIDLADPRATDAALAGAKAANLARAATAGLPVLPGFVVTTAATAGGLDGAARRAVHEARRALGPGPVVVRSSSTVEDAGTSSMAGQFTSVLGVGDEGELDRALDRVLESGRSPHSGEGGRPMAILVQPELDAARGGVLFGVDPLTGGRDLAVDAVLGSPDQVVSGSAVAWHAVLTRRGRLRRARGPGEAALPAARLRQLAHLARRAGAAFGSPQDLEWAFDAGGRLWLLQSRPVTAVQVAATGPLLGPGPLAETFPEPLAPLEVDLWIEPLREGITGALAVVGVVPERRIRSSPVVAVIGGWPAVDLDLIGARPGAHRGWRRLDPLAAVRRLVAAWRTGRLRAALPLLAADLVRAVDEELLAVPPLDELDDRRLVEVLAAGTTDLRALHGYEVLAGMLLPADGPTASGVALDALARRATPSDAVAVAEEPVLLMHLAPRIGGEPALPPVGPGAADDERIADLGPRESLRLRCRWVQELGARAAAELGTRLAERGALASAGAVRDLGLGQLRALLAGAAVDAPAPFVPGPPLPTMFRLGPGASPRGLPPASPDGLPASGGRAVGRVRHGGSGSPPEDGDVLVVDALAPQLAAELGRVAAIVSETGSPLSHLAILARERAVPVAVGVERARARFPEGSVVLVDGSAGTVSIVEEATP